MRGSASTIRTRPVGRCMVMGLATGLLTLVSARGAEKADRGVSPASTQARLDAPLHANAGEDQNAKVGDRVTLDGSASEPQTGLSFRWIPAGGPHIRLKLEDQRVYTWIPEAPGVYRFALVVAGTGRISEADFVEITVVDDQRVATRSAVIESVTREGLRALNAPEILRGELAEVYERIAGKLDLYESYNMLLHELSRSLEPLIPSDPMSRGSWNDRLFVPLSSHLVEQLRAESLDLSRPGALTTPLTDAQRRALASFFRDVADGCGVSRDN